MSEWDGSDIRFNGKDVTYLPEMEDNHGLEHGDLVAWNMISAERDVSLAKMKVDKSIASLKKLIELPSINGHDIKTDDLKKLNARLRDLEDAKDSFDKNRWEAKKTTPNLYSQTFFTNRAKGDESHLLSWYEPVSEENKKRIERQLSKEGVTLRTLKETEEGSEKFSYLPVDEKDYKTLPAGGIYSALDYTLGSAKAASEFLARADIDGIKYPVDSYGGKGVKDGDKAGWNYVSFRDDNIRIDHKWVDGRMRFSLGRLTDGREYVNVTNVPPEFRSTRNINDKKRIVGAYIRNRWKGKVIDEDGVRAFVNGATAHEYTNPAKRTTEQVFSDKLDAATELEAIVATSTNPSIVPDGQNGHVHKGVKHWEHRDVMFAVDGRIYAGKVNIKVLDKTNDKDENQRLMHDVTDIKDITDEVGTLIDDSSKEASSIGESDDSIPYFTTKSQGGVSGNGLRDLLRPANPSDASTRFSLRNDSAERVAALVGAVGVLKGEKLTDQTLDAIRKSVREPRQRSDAHADAACASIGTVLYVKIDPSFLAYIIPYFPLINRRFLQPPQSG